MSDFSVKASFDDDGLIISAYFTLKKGKYHETKSIIDGCIMADYDETGNLLGIETLGELIDDRYDLLRKKLIQELGCPIIVEDQFNSFASINYNTFVKRFCLQKITPKEF